MHQSILVQRKAAALVRILSTSRALGEQLHLDPRLTDALEPKGIKDPQVVDMMRLEALADLLDQVAAQPGAAAGEDAVSTETAPPAFDDLPEPVDGPFDEEIIPGKAKLRGKRKAKP